MYSDPSARQAPYGPYRGSHQGWLDTAGLCYIAYRLAVPVAPPRPGLCDSRRLTGRLWPTRGARPDMWLWSECPRRPGHRPGGCSPAVSGCPTAGARTTAGRRRSRPLAAQSRWPDRRRGPRICVPSAPSPMVCRWPVGGHSSSHAGTCSLSQYRSTRFRRTPVLDLRVRTDHGLKWAGIDSESKAVLVCITQYGPLAQFGRASDS